VSGKDEELTFEEAVGRLEAIVSAMEMGTLPLQDCLKQFEEAVALSRHCAAQLEQAETAIRVLEPDGGTRPAHEFTWALEDSGA
jgi:exodeoxyribonuclease VII small subunit